MKKKIIFFIYPLCYAPEYSQEGFMRHVKENKNSNYDKDFYSWALTQANLLKNKEFTKLDLENIAEEIESLGRSDKRSLKNYLTVLLQHLLKNNYISDLKGNSQSWDATIINCREQIKDLLNDSPSLKNEIKKLFNNCFESARDLAIAETNPFYEDRFPKKCPWSLKEVLGE